VSLLNVLAKSRVQSLDSLRLSPVKKPHHARN